jgi:hypothetical protein
MCAYMSCQIALGLESTYLTLVSLGTYYLLGLHVSSNNLNLKHGGPQGSVNHYRSGHDHWMDSKTARTAFLFMLHRVHNCELLSLLMVDALLIILFPPQIGSNMDRWSVFAINNKYLLQYIQPVPCSSRPTINPNARVRTD